MKKVNEKLKNKYNITAFPTTIIIDSNGNILGRIEAYRSQKTSEIYSNLFNAILNSLI